jgi:hypothetical protein
MKKLLVLIGIGVLVFWLLKDRLGSEPDEFVFTEAPASDATSTDQPANTAY